MKLDSQWVWAENVLIRCCRAQKLIGRSIERKINVAVSGFCAPYWEMTFPAKMTVAISLIYSGGHMDKKELSTELPIPFRKGFKWGFCDIKKNIIIPLKFDDAQDFNEELAAVMLNKKWGYIDKTGKEIIPLKYDNSNLFREGLSAVMLNGKWGYITNTGEELTPLKYDDVWRFNEGLCWVMYNGKWSYIDKTGKEIIQLKYDEVSPFIKGLARVKLNGRWGYINTTGTEYWEN
jgi:hypothetical protein